MVIPIAQYPGRLWRQEVAVGSAFPARDRATFSDREGATGGRSRGEGGWVCGCVGGGLGCKQVGGWEGRWGKGD